MNDLEKHVGISYQELTSEEKDVIAKELRRARENFLKENFLPQ